MTEEEAKQKWCPFVRHTADGTDAASNRYATQSGATPEQQWNACIGSACMAWRFNRDDWSENMSTGAITYHQGGYCGLAGKP